MIGSAVASAGSSAADSAGGFMNSVTNLFGGGSGSPALTLSFPLYHTKGNGFDENMKDNQIKLFKQKLRARYPHMANSNYFSESGWWNDKTSNAARQIGIWSDDVNQPIGGVTAETFAAIMNDTYNWEGGTSSSSSSSSSSKNTSKPKPSRASKPKTSGGGILDSVLKPIKPVIDWFKADKIRVIGGLALVVGVLWKFTNVFSFFGGGSVSGKSL